MHPVTHVEISWLIANIPTKCNRKDRLFIFMVGIIPDADGVGIFFKGEAYVRFHHVLAHNILFGLLLTIIAFFISERRFLTPIFVLLSFHVHMIADMLGSGPNWPIVYLWPFRYEEWYFEYQWNLVSWQNFFITFAATIFCLIVAVKKGRTPLEFISLRLDKKVAKAIKRRWNA